jgi:hypothetical protein
MPNTANGFSVQAGASLDLQGYDAADALILQGNGQVGVGCVAGGTVYASWVFFQSFSYPAVDVMGGSAYITNCAFTQNTAPGIFLGNSGEWSKGAAVRACMVGPVTDCWALSVLAGYLLLKGSDFYSNDITSGVYTDGAGLSLNSGTAVVMDSQFYQNTANSGQNRHPATAGCMLYCFNRLTS